MIWPALFGICRSVVEIDSGSAERAVWIVLKRPSVLLDKIVASHFDSLVLYHPVFVDWLASNGTNKVIGWVKVRILVLELPCSLRLVVKIPFDY